MIRSLRIQPLAEEDLHETYAWYEQQAMGLGDRFMDAVDEGFHRIRENADQFPVIYKQVRRALLQTFPFCIYFIMVNDVAFVLAVLHGHRNPAVWKRRARI